ncbi:MAG TPA: delta-60 repeat domain-containing protein [Candidatus Saccharimonadales bacterium]|nr:delta-60 repeat domain-containing protein [Candidatus Saccharimonadales bacterium]
MSILVALTQSTSAQPALEASPPTRDPFPSTMLLTLDTAPGTLAIQPDGKILVGSALGGWFVDEQSGMVGWYSRGAIRLESDGSIDRSFYCNIDRPGVAIPGSAHLDLLTDGRIFVSGTFSMVDEVPRPGYAMLQSDGRLDQSFEPWQGRTNISGRTFLPGGTFRAAALSNGSVAVMSDSIEGPRAPYPLTAYLLDFSGNWIQRTLTNAPVADWGYPPGLILTLGWGGFWARSPVDWSNWTELKRQYWVPLGSDRPPLVDLPFWLWPGQPTAAQAAVVFQALFEEVPIELCKYAVRMPHGGTVLAVSEGTPLRTKAHLMRFDRDWHPAPDFSTHFESDYRRSLRLKRIPDGKFLLAGAETIEGVGFPGLVRLDEHGALDRTFFCSTTNAPASMVYDFGCRRMDASSFAAISPGSMTLPPGSWLA